MPHEISLPVVSLEKFFFYPHQRLLVDSGGMGKLLHDLRFHGNFYAEPWAFYVKSHVTGTMVLFEYWGKHPDTMAYIYYPNPQHSMIDKLWLTC